MTVFKGWPSISEVIKTEQLTLSYKISLFLELILMHVQGTNKRNEVLWNMGTVKEFMWDICPKMKLISNSLQNVSRNTLYIDYIHGLDSVLHSLFTLCINLKQCFYSTKEKCQKHFTNAKQTKTANAFSEDKSLDQTSMYWNMSWNEMEINCRVYSCSVQWHHLSPIAIQLLMWYLHVIIESNDFGSPS